VKFPRPLTRVPLSKVKSAKVVSTCPLAWIRGTVNFALNLVMTSATIVGSVTASLSTSYLVDASSGALTVTLPVASGNQGGWVSFKRIDWLGAFTVTIVPNPSDTGATIDISLAQLLLRPELYVWMFIDSAGNWQRFPQDPGDHYVFGNGADGSANISSNTTLSRDMYYRSLVVSGGAILNTNGFRVCVRDRLALTGTGTSIQNNGGNASTSTAGSAGAAGSLLGGFAGAAGAAGTVVVGSAGAQGSPATSTAGSVGGVGGAGGLEGANAGSAGGANVVPSAAAGGVACLQQLGCAFAARDLAAAQLVGGSGGGSGAASTNTATGGAGGGGGGIVVIAARHITCPAVNSCTIQANGGNGGDATGTGITKFKAKLTVPRI
jgi:hypothetical protein